MFNHITWCPSWFYFGAPFISNIYCRSFLFELYLDFASYANDTTSYICGQDFNSIIKVLEPHANTLSNWFPQNGLLANSGNSHFLTSPYKRRSLKINDSVITSSSSEELLGVLIDSELTFRDYIT